MDVPKQSGSQLGQYITFGGSISQNGNIVYKATKAPPGNNERIYILKKYKTKIGFQKQKKVFQLPLYQNYYIQSKTIQILGDQDINFTVCKYYQNGCFQQLSKYVPTFSFKVAKFYLHQLLTKLYKIHHEYKIPFRKLYTSDIIFSHSCQLVIVGWSKQNQAVSQEQLLYYCAQFFYSLLTNSIFQIKGIHTKDFNNNSCLYVDQSFWSIKQGKKSYLKFFSKQEEKIDQLINFFIRMTVQKQSKIKSLSEALKDKFFIDLITFEEASKELLGNINQKRQKQNQRIKKDFNRKIKIHQKSLELKQQYKKTRGRKQKHTDLSQYSQYRSYYQEKQKYIQTTLPISIKIKNSNKNQFQYVQDQFQDELSGNIDQKDTQEENQRIEENSNQTKSFDNNLLCHLIVSYIQDRLQNSNNGVQIFNQDWISAQFNLELLKDCYESVTTEISELEKVQIKFVCKLTYGKNKEYLQQSQYQFIIEVILNQQKKPGNKCIQQCQLRALLAQDHDQQSQLHQLLFIKLRNYIFDGLVESFVYSP